MRCLKGLFNILIVFSFFASNKSLGTVVQFGEQLNLARFYSGIFELGACPSLYLGYNWRLGRMPLRELLGHKEKELKITQAQRFFINIFVKIAASGKRDVITPEFIERTILDDALLPPHRSYYFANISEDGEYLGVMSLFDGRDLKTYKGKDAKFNDASVLPLERKFPMIAGKLNSSKVEFRHLATRAGTDRLKHAEEIFLAALESASSPHFLNPADADINIHSTLYVHADELTAKLYQHKYGLKIILGPDVLKTPNQYILAGNVNDLLSKLKVLVGKVP